MVVWVLGRQGNGKMKGCWDLGALGLDHVKVNEV